MKKLKRLLYDKKSSAFQVGGMFSTVGGFARAQQMEAEKMARWRASQASRIAGGANTFDENGMPIEAGGYDPYSNMSRGFIEDMGMPAPIDANDEGMMNYMDNSTITPGQAMPIQTSPIGGDIIGNQIAPQNISTVTPGGVQMTPPAEVTPIGGRPEQPSAVIPGSLNPGGVNIVNPPIDGGGIISTTPEGGQQVTPEGGQQVTPGQGGGGQQVTPPANDPNSVSKGGKNINTESVKSPKVTTKQPEKRDTDYTKQGQYKNGRNKSEFNSAFKKARADWRSGKSEKETFDFNGKKYSIETADDKKAYRKRQKEGKNIASALPAAKVRDVSVKAETPVIKAPMKKAPIKKKEVKRTKRKDRGKPGTVVSRWNDKRKARRAKRKADRKSKKNAPKAIVTTRIDAPDVKVKGGVNVKQSQEGKDKKSTKNKKNDKSASIERGKI